MPPIDLSSELTTACSQGDLSLVKDLYKSLAENTDASSHFLLSQMALLATKSSQPDILSFCFSQGFKLDPDDVNDMLIYTVGGHGSIELWDVLLSNGLDVNKYLESGGSPLVMACAAGNFKLAELLLDRNANPNNGYHSGGYQALVWAVSGPDPNRDIVELLIKRNTKVKGTGALVAAAEIGNIDAVQLLLEEPDVHIDETEDYGTDEGGVTALYKAAAEGHDKIVDMLLEKGANRRFTDPTGKSVAVVAEENGHEEIARRVRTD